MDIIVIGDSILEAYALRSILECFNIQTRIHLIGNVKHLVALFREGNYLYNTTIISCHGDKEGVVIPELSQELEENMPFHKNLNPSDFLKILNLSNQLIINTGCSLGTEKFSRSFLDKGASAYIGSTDDIEGTTMLAFIFNFMYFYFVMKLSLKESFHKAQSFLDEEIKKIELWERRMTPVLCSEES